MDGEGATIALALERSGAMRAVSWATVAFALLGAGAVAWLGVLVGSFPDPWDLWIDMARLLAFGVALVLAGIAVWTFWAGRPPDGRILVDDEGITLENPAVFRRPVRIPRSAVLSVSVERDVASLPAQAPLDLFPIAGGGSEACPDTHLASRRRGRYLLPGINAESVVPNLAVVIDAPIKVPPMRLRGSLAPGPAHFRAPLWQRDLPGFFARVEDVDAAARVFGRWGVLRPPRPEEIVRAAESAARYRRVQVALAFLVLLAVVAVMR